MRPHGTAARTMAALFATALAAGVATAQTPTPSTPSTATPPTTTPGAPAPTPAPASPGATAPGTDESSTVQSMEIRARTALVLPGSSDWDNGFKNINAALAKVRAAATAAGLTPTGHAVAAFVDTDDNGFKFEAMLPIEKGPEGKTDLGEGVRVGATPGGKALKFQHRGAYEDIDTTYEAITAYLDEKNLEAQNVFVEEYLNEPKGPDDTSAEVDIYVLIK